MHPNTDGQLEGIACVTHEFLFSVFPTDIRLSDIPVTQGPLNSLYLSPLSHHSPSMWGPWRMTRTWARWLAVPLCPCVSKKLLVSIPLGLEALSIVCPASPSEKYRDPFESLCCSWSRAQLVKSCAGVPDLLKERGHCTLSPCIQRDILCQVCSGLHLIEDDTDQEKAAGEAAGTCYIDWHG